MANDDKRLRGAGPSQAANRAPSGGSAAATAASVGADIPGAGPSQTANRAPSGGSAAATAASVGAHIDAFCDQLWLQDGLAASSLASYRRDLVGWCAWLAKRNTAPLRAARGDFERWLADQFEAKAKATSVARRLSALRRFYRFQLDRGAITEDPTLRVRAPKKPRRLPKQLSEAQVEALLAAPDLCTPLGVRDRAMLETLYATGLRVSELTGLTRA